MSGSFIKKSRFNEKLFNFIQKSKFELDNYINYLKGKRTCFSPYYSSSKKGIKSNSLITRSKNF